MRLSRIILSLVALVAMCATPLSAQSPIDMAVRISDDTATQLGENNTTLLRNKLSKIITRNGLADSEGFFALEPSIAIIDEGIADTGMAKIRVITAELTLAVKNIVDGTIFESQTIELDGKSYGIKVKEFVFIVEIEELGGAARLEKIAPVKSITKI